MILCLTCSVVPFPLVLKYLLVSPLHRWHGITATRVSLSWYCQGARPVPCQTVDWVTLKYTRLWLHDFFHCQSLIWHNNWYEKVVLGFVRRCLGCTNWEMDERTRECSRSGGNSKCSLCFFWGSWIGGAQSRASAQKKGYQTLRRYKTGLFTPLLNSQAQNLKKKRTYRLNI